MDANFGMAWIGFAHSFAFEGEHDQAISAYSTAAKMFKGWFYTLISSSHYPAMFIGMQYLAMVWLKLMVYSIIQIWHKNICI